MHPFFYLFICGICMGAADIIPGVSGATMALILGIYEEFIDSISSFGKSLKLLFKGKIKAFVKAFPWRFLTPILLGVAIAFISFANLFHRLLSDKTHRMYLLSLFFGLIVSSAFFCLKKIERLGKKYLLLLFLGAFIAFIITVKLQMQELMYYQQLHEETLFLSLMPWIIFSGVCAICAMLLPGISGSYVLMVLGAYPLIISSLANVVSNVSSLYWYSVSVLLNLSLGVLIGALIFSQLIHWLFLHYEKATLAFLVGFMIGALPAVWPFWEYEVFNETQNGFLLPKVAVLPDVFSTSFLIACVMFSFGAFSVFFLNFLKKLSRLP